MITRKQFMEAQRVALVEEGHTTLHGALESMLWHLFDKPDAPQVDVSGMGPIKIEFNQPKPLPSIEEQLIARATDGKCALYWIDSQGQANSYINNLPYIEQLFLIDSFRRRLDYSLFQARED